MDGVHNFTRRLCDIQIYRLKSVDCVHSNENEYHAIKRDRSMLGDYRC